MTQMESPPRGNPYNSYKKYSIMSRYNIKGIKKKKNYILKSDQQQSHDKDEKPECNMEKFHSIPKL